MAEIQVRKDVSCKKDAITVWLVYIQTESTELSAIALFRIGNLLTAQRKRLPAISSYRKAFRLRHFQSARKQKAQYTTGAVAKFVRPIPKVPEAFDQSKEAIIESVAAFVLTTKSNTKTARD